MSGSIARVRASFIDGRSRTPRFIQKELRSLHDALIEHAEEIQQSILIDAGTTTEEAQIEYCLALTCLKNHYNSINFHQILSDEYSISNSSDFRSRRISAKIAYIVPSRHTLFYSIVSPLSAAITAGSCLVLELQNTVSELSRKLISILSKALDTETFAIVQEPVGDAAFLSLCIEVNGAQSEGTPKIQQLVSPSEARVVAVVDRSADIEKAAVALVSARFAFSGCSPYAPDLVLVNEFIFDEFSRAAAQESARHFTNSVSEKHDTSKALTPEELQGDSTIVIVSGAKGSIARLENRTSLLFRKKINKPALLILPVRSLDDAIDLANEGETLLATNVFAGPEEAKYLSQFIDANAAFVNHIPIQLLVGPAAPLNYVVNLDTRYTTEMFSTPRPQFAVAGPKAQALTYLHGSSDKDQFGSFLGKALEPLPPSDQPAGGSIGHFEQGLFVGLAILFIPIVGGITFLGYTGVKAALQRRGLA